MAPRMFGALLRAWRNRRGMSQLDLALAAEVSSRHISFLETGRSGPSASMTLRLASVLSLSLRDQNELLLAAGFERRFPEAPALPAEISQVLEQMKRQQEPYPLVVLDAAYDVLDTNAAARGLFDALVGTSPTPPNLLMLLFDPAGLRPYVLEWDALAERLLSRLRKEMLASPDDERLANLFSTLLGYPGVPHFALDPLKRLDAALALRWNVGGETLAFLTTMTTFSVPQDIGVSELRIESFYPLDAATKAHCEGLCLRRD